MLLSLLCFVRKCKHVVYFGPQQRPDDSDVIKSERGQRPSSLVDIIGTARSNALWGGHCLCACWQRCVFSDVYGLVTVAPDATRCDQMRQRLHAAVYSRTCAQFLNRFFFLKRMLDLLVV